MASPRSRRSSCWRLSASRPGWRCLLFRTPAREARTQTINNLHQLGKATHKHAEQYNAKMPVNGGPNPPLQPLNGKTVSIFYHLLPFVQHQDACDRNATETVVAAYL